MNNYLLPILENYFKEILRQESKMKISQSFLHNKRTDIESENRVHRSIYSSITSYRDLTKLEGGDNLFCPNHSYEMSVDDMENDIADIVSQQCCFAVAQSYEAFESYLTDIITEFLLFNQGRLQEVKIPATKILLLKDTIRSLVRKDQGTNNKGHLSMLRKLSVHFQSFENNNIHNVNICHWFDLLSMVRHIIIHNRQGLSAKFLKYLDTHNATGMFDRNFRRKKIEGNIRVYLETDLAGDVICWLNSFAHFIFVSLSKEANLSLSVSSYMPPPLNMSRIA